jgi:glycosyltransferase involved in cell wall biosynthesis
LPIIINKKEKRIIVAQVLPEINSGGVERGTLELGKYLSDHGHESIVISGGGRLESQLIREGSRHILLCIGRKSLLTFFLIPKLISILLKNKIDIIHARSRMPAWICYFALKFIAKRNRPIFITTIHGPYSINFYSSIMTKGERVFVVSKMIRKYALKNYNVTKNQLVLNYRGVNSKEFIFGYKPKILWIKKWFKEHPQTKDKIILTLPGRITRWKGQEDFIKMISDLVSKNNKIHGLLVGEVKNGKEKYKSQLLKQIENLGIKDHITFTGNRSDLKEIMAMSHIVYSLSKEPEAFGRTTLESIKLGVPIIGYSHGGVGEQLGEIFPEGLIPVNSHKKLVSLSEKWIKNSPLVRPTNKFSLRSMLNTTLKTYIDIFLIKNDIQ